MEARLPRSAELRKCRSQPLVDGGDEDGRRVVARVALLAVGRLVGLVRDGAADPASARVGAVFGRGVRLVSASPARPGTRPSHPGPAHPDAFQHHLELRRLAPMPSRNHYRHRLLPLLDRQVQLGGQPATRAAEPVIVRRYGGLPFAQEDTPEPLKDAFAALLERLGGGRRGRCPSGVVHRGVLGGPARPGHPDPGGTAAAGGCRAEGGATAVTSLARGPSPPSERGDYARAARPGAKVIRRGTSGTRAAVAVVRARWRGVRRGRGSRRRSTRSPRRW